MTMKVYVVELVKWEKKVQTVYVEAPVGTNFDDVNISDALAGLAPEHAWNDDPFHNSHETVDCWCVGSTDHKPTVTWLDLESEMELVSKEGRGE